MRSSINHTNQKVRWSKWRERRARSEWHPNLISLKSWTRSFAYSMTIGRLVTNKSILMKGHSAWNRQTVHTTRTSPKTTSSIASSSRVSVWGCTTKNARRLVSPWSTEIIQTPSKIAISASWVRVFANLRFLPKIKMSQQMYKIQI